MIDKDSWNAGYFNEKFANPDPWAYFTSGYEHLKYTRQIDVIKDRRPNLDRMLEIGSAEGAQTLMLLEQFPKASITTVELSSRAIERAKDNLSRYGKRAQLVNADIKEYEPMLQDNGYDVCIWSESIYYVGAQLSLLKTYGLLERIIGKLKGGGILVMANSVDLPEDIPESEVTKRPLMDCYHHLLSHLAAPAQRAVYVEEKLGRLYEYQIWAFIR
jgi:trans-aconitate methyltransferase